MIAHTTSVRLFCGCFPTEESEQPERLMDIGAATRPAEDGTGGRGVDAREAAVGVMVVPRAMDLSIGDSKVKAHGEPLAKAG